MKQLNSMVAEYYKSQSLSDESLHRILRAGKHARAKRKRRPLMLIAALFLVSVISVGFIQYRMTNTFTDAAVTEIARNHMKNAKSKVITASFSELSETLDKLSFSFEKPDFLAGYTLIGGKYCSVQGEKAAQLKLISPKGVETTLYVTLPRGKLDRLTGSHKGPGNHSVEFVHADSLLWALVE